MAGSLWANFCGGAYKAISQLLSADEAINVYPETRQVPGSAKTVALIGTPGVRELVTVPTSGCRGWFTLNGQTWVVVGDVLYEYFVAGATYTARATIPNDGKMVSFASNGQTGNQLGVCGGGVLTVLNLVSNAPAVAPLPFGNPVTIVFQDGYGLINEGDTPKVYFSALEDLLTWDPLDFFTRVGTPDNVIGLAISRDRLWVLGSKTTTLYYNSGYADTPWVPYPGTTSQVGLVNAQAVGLYNDVVYWVAESAKGTRRVVRASDPSPEEISTPPINAWLSRCATVENMELLIYEQEGHPFVCITNPNSDDALKTYCYDVREDLWHARAALGFTTGEWERWRVRGSTVADGVILVGDHATGSLYTLELDWYFDAALLIKRQRTAPYLSSVNQWLFVDQFELASQQGVGTPSVIQGRTPYPVDTGVNPTVELEISRDGGHTFISAGSTTLGAIGECLSRAIWRNLGRFRADRMVYRVSMTDPVQCAWMGAWIDAQAGTGRL